MWIQWQMSIVTVFFLDGYFFFSLSLLCWCCCCYYYLSLVYFKNIFNIICLNMIFIFHHHYYFFGSNWYFLESASCNMSYRSTDFRKRSGINNIVRPSTLYVSPRKKDNVLNFSSTSPRLKWNSWLRRGNIPGITAM